MTTTRSYNVYEEANLITEFLDICFRLGLSEHQVSILLPDITRGPCKWDVQLYD